MAVLRQIAFYGRGGIVYDLPKCTRRSWSTWGNHRRLRSRRTPHLNAKAQELKSVRRVRLAQLVSNECQSPVREAARWDSNQDCRVEC